MPPGFQNIQWEVYIVFGVFCFSMFVHVFFMFPETAGKTLEEVNEIFTDPNGPRYIGTPAWKTRVSTRRTLAEEHGEIDFEKGDYRGSTEKNAEAVVDHSENSPTRS